MRGTTVRSARCPHGRWWALLVTVLSISASLAAPPVVAAEAPGERVYREACAVCHLEAGEGLAGVYPPLANSGIVLGDPTELVRLLLQGRGGMPSYAGELSDADLAAVITFTRCSWGNIASAISPELVGQIADTLGRDALPTR